MQDPGIRGVQSLDELVITLAPPRVLWLVRPASVTGDMVAQLESRLAADDIVIDGGNSHYRDDAARAHCLAERGIHYVDCGTIGGIFGLERGLRLMTGRATRHRRSRVTCIAVRMAPVNS